MRESFEGQYLPGATDLMYVHLLALHHSSIRRVRIDVVFKSNLKLAYIAHWQRIVPIYLLLQYVRVGWNRECQGSIIDMQLSRIAN